jgi:acetyl-CoA carboxylase alpha subunit
MPLHPLQAEWDADLAGGDPLGFPGYAEERSRAASESVLTGRTAHYALIESRFEVLGGSMGAVSGERVVRAYRRATDERIPVLVVAASGGARLQEGMVALVQMARTARAARRHAGAGLLSLGVYRPPTTGGVLASYASLVDLRAAEPRATMGFAGPRVVEQTLGVRVPEGSHTAEGAFDHGLVDALVDREGQADWVESALGLRETPLTLTRRPPVLDAGGPGDLRTGSPAPAWEEVQRARAPDRPSGLDWAARLCSSWTDLHGTDPVVRAGLATVSGRRTVVVAMDRHAGAGRPTPDGYRLAQRAIALAGRLRLPLLSLVDTPGADPGPGSEAGGIAAEIARTLAAMAELPTASVAVCVGEGGSGGALAVAFTDRLLIQEHAVFSVIAPEGAAAILDRDAARAPRMAGRLRLTSADLLELGIVDAVVAEDPGTLGGQVAAALAEAEPGDRSRRFDAATARWLS